MFPADKKDTDKKYFIRSIVVNPLPCTFSLNAVDNKVDVVEEHEDHNYDCISDRFVLLDLEEVFVKFFVCKVQSELVEIRAFSHSEVV